jgi:hypothetical protein
VAQQQLTIATACSRVRVASIWWAWPASSVRSCIGNRAVGEYTGQLCHEMSYTTTLLQRPSGDAGDNS